MARYPMKSLTLFAGAGGADYGMTQAGVEHVRCIEYDKNAHATLAAAGFPAVLGDVRDPTLYRDLPPLDLMWASPPCQDWSSAGKREGASGKRNGWPWTWAVVRHLQRRGLGPTWLICENVTGMLTHSGEHCGKGCCADPTRCPTTYWHEVIMREARALFPWADYRVIDAADFGTPQFRKRVFLVAGPRPIDWPKPTHGAPTNQRGLFGPGLNPWKTVREALGLDGHLDAERGAGMADRHGERRMTPTEEPSPAVRARSRGAPPFAFVRTEQRGATATPDTMPAPTVPTVPTVGNQYLHAKDPGVRVFGGGRNPQSAAVAHKRTLRDITDEPSTTIAAQVGGGAGNAGPFVVTAGRMLRSQSQRELDPDRPADTLSAGTPSGSHRAPFLTTRAGSEPDRLDRPADCLVAGSTKSNPNGRSIVSASASAREEFFAAMNVRAFARGDESVDMTDRPAHTIPSNLGKSSVWERCSMGLRVAKDAAPKEALVLTTESPCGVECSTPDRPSPAVTIGNGAGKTGLRYREETGDYRRRLTVSECAALFDMPADYPWQGTKTSQYRQIGNMCAWKCVAALVDAVQGTR